MFAVLLLLFFPPKGLVQKNLVGCAYKTLGGESGFITHKVTFLSLLNPKETWVRKVTGTVLFLTVVTLATLWETGTGDLLPSQVGISGSSFARH